MAKRGKRYQTALKELDRTVLYAPEDAVEKLINTAKAKFDETIEVAIRLGIDPKKGEQTVRGTIVLPNGTGKTPRVIVFAKGEKAKDAEDAGANAVGTEDLINKVKEGWADFDLVVATPDMMGQVGSNLGRILGPRMPNPKAGTVTQDIKKTVQELKSGKVQYRNDKQGIIHNIIGKASFGKEKILQNLMVLIDAVVRAKPASSKGTFLKSVVLSSTMGPGIKVDPSTLTAKAQGKK